MKRRGCEMVIMLVQSPSDHTSTIRLPYAVAWAAARGIAMHT
jgi:hypothetical protein